MPASPSEPLTISKARPDASRTPLMKGGTLVLFVDLQEGLIDASKTNAARQIRQSASALLAISRTLDLPCLASVVPAGPKGAPPLITELEQATPPIDVRVRQTISALSAIDQPPDRLILCGLAMEAAILHTALDARDAGISVEVLVDVCGGLSARTEEAAIRQMERAGVATSSLPSFATSCVANFTTLRDQRVMQTLQALL